MPVLGYPPQAHWLRSAQFTPRQANVDALEQTYSLGLAGQFFIWFAAVVTDTERRPDRSLGAD